MLGDVLAEAGRAVAQELAKTTKARFVAVDLNDPDLITAFARDVARHEGEIHGLVNNAAIATNVGGKPFDEIDLDLWDSVMRVNVRTWLVTRAWRRCSPTASTAASSTSASDTALWGRRGPRLCGEQGRGDRDDPLAARELGPRGIGVTVVAPGILRCEATEYVPAERHRLYETGRAVPDRRRRRTSSTPWCSCSRRERWRSPGNCCRSMRGSSSHERDHASHGRRHLLPRA